MARRREEKSRGMRGLRARGGREGSVPGERGDEERAPGRCGVCHLVGGIGSLMGGVGRLAGGLGTLVGGIWPPNCCTNGNEVIYTRYRESRCLRYWEARAASGKVYVGDWRKSSSVD